jgi:CubicO group peptidase (beta-lactamase class C family)
MVIGTVVDGIQDLSGFGRVNLDSDIPPDGETIFEIGSISKVFTGILLADHIIKHQLTLQTPMISLIPSIPASKGSLTEQITVAHLVTHTSGLKRMPGNIFTPLNVWNFFTARDSYRQYTRADLIAAGTKRKFGYKKPGEKYAYSNVGFGLLGMGLADLNNSDYHHLVKTVIADPLGLKDTGVFLNNHQQSRMAKGYRTFLHIGRLFLAQTAENWNFPECIAGAGGLRSTGNDMLKFLSANMGFIKTDLYPALAHSQTTIFSNKTVEVGMGWHHNPLKPSNEIMITWHNGKTGGFSNFLGFTRDRRLGVIILSNSTRDVDSLGHKILNAFLAEVKTGEEVII